MSDWSEQMTEYQKNWVAQQQKMLTEWLESLKGAGAGAGMGNWRQAADVMEKQVNSALDMQKKSLLALLENMENVEGAPDAFNQSVKQFEDGIEQWAEVQQKIWHVWFDTLRSADPTPRSPAETMMQSWEDMAKRTMAIQEEWLSSWTEAAGKQDKSNT